MRVYASERGSSGIHARDHGLAPRRESRELADVQVAVDGEGERARDRRGGHVEDVRASALRERAPLSDAEPVLLVDDDDREIAEVDLLLDQRVRPDDERRVTRGDELPHGRVLARPQRAREQRDAHPERAAQLVDGQEVLLGEGLGGRHERRLPAGLDGAEERVERDDGLPGADVSLEQAVHRSSPREIGVDLRDRPLLIRP